MTRKKTNRMISESLDKNAASITEATLNSPEYSPLAAVKPSVGKKAVGRPPVRPPCHSVTFKLPIDLLEHVQIMANEKTGGNKTLLVEQILKAATKCISDKIPSTGILFDEETTFKRVIKSGSSRVERCTFLVNLTSFYGTVWNHIFIK